MDVLSEKLFSFFTATPPSFFFTKGAKVKPITFVGCTYLFTLFANELMTEKLASPRFGEATYADVDVFNEAMKIVANAGCANTDKNGDGFNEQDIACLQGMPATLDKMAACCEAQEEPLKEMIEQAEKYRTLSPKSREGLKRKREKFRIMCALASYMSDELKQILPPLEKEEPAQTEKFYGPLRIARERTFQPQGYNANGPMK